MYRIESTELISEANFKNIAKLFPDSEIVIIFRVSHNDQISNKSYDSYIPHGYRPKFLQIRSYKFIFSHSNQK